jgi:ribosomal protein S12 methylthiotransferase
VIVGFPGETDADFDELKAFLDTIRFDRLGAFAYSREEDTPAYGFADQIPEDVKAVRLDTILSKQQKIARQKAKERIGSVQTTLVEQYDSTSRFYYGRSAAFAPDDLDGYIVFQSKQKHAVGDLVDVVVKTIIGADWIGDARIE